MRKTSFGRSFFCLRLFTSPSCRSELAREKRKDTAFFQHWRVIVSDLREQARSYRGSPLKHRLVFALLFISASASAAPPTLDPLLNSVAERLEIAAQVALGVFLGGLALWLVQLGATAIMAKLAMGTLQFGG